MGLELFLNIADYSISILGGICVLSRTWQKYNYLLVRAGKPSVGFIHYFNADNNLLFNFWKIVPVLDKVQTTESASYKVKVNRLTYLSYLFICLSVILLWVEFHLHTQHPF
jgi:hypothetical protein